MQAILTANDEIKRQLAMLDAAAIRPQRAILAAQLAGQTPAAADIAKLAALESQAQELRGRKGR